MGGRERGRKLQIHRLPCKPICKPDAARQPETGETEPTERDGVYPVRRGNRTRERRLETGETHVVVLITQRSRVQIPPRYQFPQVKALSQLGEGLCVPGTVVKTCSRNSVPCGLAARRGRWGRTERDSVDVVDVAARDRWVPGPEVAPCPRSLRSRNWIPPADLWFLNEDDRTVYPNGGWALRPGQATGRIVGGTRAHSTCYRAPDTCLLSMQRCS